MWEDIRKKILENKPNIEDQQFDALIELVKDYQQSTDQIISTRKNISSMEIPPLEDADSEIMNKLRKTLTGLASGFMVGRMRNRLVSYDSLLEKIKHLRKRDQLPTLPTDLRVKLNSEYMKSFPSTLFGLDEEPNYVWAMNEEEMKNYNAVVPRIKDAPAPIRYWFENKIDNTRLLEIIDTINIVGLEREYFAEFVETAVGLDILRSFWDEDSFTSDIPDTLISMHIRNTQYEEWHVGSNFISPLKFQQLFYKATIGILVSLFTFDKIYENKEKDLFWMVGAYRATSATTRPYERDSNSYQSYITNNNFPSNHLEKQRSLLEDLSFEELSNNIETYIPKPEFRMKNIDDIMLISSNEDAFDYKSLIDKIDKHINQKWFSIPARYANAIEDKTKEQQIKVMQNNFVKYYRLNSKQSKQLNNILNIMKEEERLLLLNLSFRAHEIDQYDPIKEAIVISFFAMYGFRHVIKNKLALGDWVNHAWQKTGLTLLTRFFKIRYLMLPHNPILYSKIVNGLYDHIIKRFHTYFKFE